MTQLLTLFDIITKYSPIIVNKFCKQDYKLPPDKWGGGRETFSFVEISLKTSQVMNEAMKVIPEQLVVVWHWVILKGHKITVRSISLIRFTDVETPLYQNDTTINYSYQTNKIKWLWPSLKVTKADIKLIQYIDVQMKVSKWSKYSLKSYCTKMVSLLYTSLKGCKGHTMVNIILVGNIGEENICLNFQNDPSIPERTSSCH